MALTAEEARAALLAIRDEGWRAAAGRPVARLPRADRGAARAFLENEPSRQQPTRGRVFLPFADDDPKTAEVLAKILLLADDRQIRDPTILQQLRS